MSEQRNSIVTYGGEGEAKPWLFKPGNKASLGHRNAAKSLAYKAILREELTEERWREVVRSMVDKARAGDVAAAKWLSDILIPKNIKARGMVLTLTPEEAQKKIDQLFGLDLQIGASDDGDDAEGGAGGVE